MTSNTGTFLQNLAQGHNKMTLIGMSGLGKSHWSKILEKQGFKRFCCDDMIAARLLDRCEHPEGKIGCLGRWMGFPFDSGYQDKAQAYLSAETDVLQEIIAYLGSSNTDEKVIIDTTGSAPYVGEEIMGQFRERTLMVHLAISESVMASMLARYIQSPRPILWGDLYTKQPSETDQMALAHSYKVLLPYREALYLKYAHRSIPYDLHHTD